MKHKKLLIVIIALIAMLSLVSAMVYNTKTEAITAARDIKLAGVSVVDVEDLNLEYMECKCILNVHTELTEKCYCEAVVKNTVTDDEVIFMIDVSDKSTEEERETACLEYSLNLFDTEIPKYIEYKME